MNLTKLKIEAHNTNLKNKLDYTKTQTYSNLKNIKLVRNLFKLKLEDRKRIRGINFSTHKKEKNNYTLYKLKRKEEATMLQYDEANFQKVLNKYNKLKHEIFIKEQKEKRQKTQETLMKEKLIKRDINYTFLKETLYQFMRFKKSYNKYSVDLLKNKNEIKIAEKNSKKNFINKTVKSVIKRFNHLDGKIDFGGIHRREELANEKEYDNLIKQISKSRLKHLKSASKSNNNQKSITASSASRKYVPKKTQEYSHKNSPYVNIIKINNNDDEEFSISNSSREHEEEKNEKGSILNLNCKTDINDSIGRNKYINDDKKAIITKKKKPEINIFNRNDLKDTGQKRVKTSKYKTFIVSKPLIFNNLNNNNIKTSIFDIKENEKENEIKSSSSKTVKYKKLKDKNKQIEENKNENNDRNILINDLINLDLIKKNNSLKKKNSVYWNNNIKRLYSAVSRNNHKVINKPLYVTKISDFVKEFHRIKSVSKSAKKRMKEKHLTTMDNINKISKIKEELLMFVLKMKYFHHSFPQKKAKNLSKKEIFVKKFKNYIDIIDNPYSLATKDLRTEIRKDKDD